MITAQIMKFSAIFIMAVSAEVDGAALGAKETSKLSGDSDGLTVMDPIMDPIKEWLKNSTLPGAIMNMQDKPKRLTSTMSAAGYVRVTSHCYVGQFTPGVDVCIPLEPKVDSTSCDRAEKTPHCQVHSDVQGGRARGWRRIHDAAGSDGLDQRATGDIRGWPVFRIYPQTPQGSKTPRDVLSSWAGLRIVRVCEGICTDLARQTDSAILDY
jgi:hypothetical protein